MTDNDLRTMLRARARDIDHFPDQLAEPPAATPSRQHRMWAVAASVAVIAAVTGAVLVTRADRPNPPGADQTPAGCATSLPQPWQTAFGSRTDVVPLAVTADGSVIATSPDGIVRITRDGTTTTLVRVQSGVDGIGTVTTTGTDVVVPIEHLQGPGADVAAGTIGVGKPAVTSVLVIPGDGSATTTIPTMSDRQLADGTHVVDGAAALDGHVYWDVRPDDGSQTGRIEDYDIATGTTGTAYTGTVAAPSRTARGVDWGTGGTPAELPAAVERALPPGQVRVVTDGEAFAWATGAAITWLGPDGTTVGPIPQDVAAAPVLRAVAGPVVFFTGPHRELYLLDSRTGGVADAGHTFGGHAYAGGGMFAAQLTGGPDDYSWVTVDTAGLPELAC